MAAIITWLVLVAIIIIISLVIVCITKKPMQQLLSTNSYILPSKDFYVRTFAITIFLVAAAGVSGANMPGEGKAFMEYVWLVTNALEQPLFYMSIWVILYATILTILYAVLGRFHD